MFTLVAVIVLSVGHISLESRAIYSEHSALSDTSSALTAMTVAALVQIGNPGVHGRPRVRVLANTSIVVLQPEILGKKPHPAPGN
ncbi:hypothetical protein A3A40_02715 [Candidatus Kaiserbacteria bacterium RIFCSPLOWO2_01_FULL_54_20]|uniref:Uncharacterized protein n=1 Tax=Candidatus Kaiserbacteria bacterium RIFCSPLOWO2_01_FULL_54_20 TaxID=1798513 RepID=A0A1F6EJU9_9BACT|nr:MAG: hypothetical protein A3A40_02715 [Candidatus Kaiserbacteria bacterium RIFCSPLOWO2_01_FULL_54_20]